MLSGSVVLVAHIERGRDEIQRQEHGEQEASDHADAATGPYFIADATKKNVKEYPSGL